MAFNLQEFRSQITKHGFAQDNLFVVELLGTENFAEGMPARDLSFFAQTAGLPEFNLTTADIVHNGMGATTRRPTGMQYPVVPVTFFVDSNHNIMKFFHRWIQRIVNYDRSGITPVEAGAQNPFELNYKSDYEASMRVTIFPRYQEKLPYIYEFSGVYPVSVGAVTTSMSNEGLILLPVGFTYDSIKVSGGEALNTLSLANRANSLLTYFSSLNTVVQSFRDIDSPLDVQQAINQSSRILDTIFD